jgi:hypothetical protein
MRIEIEISELLSGRSEDVGGTIGFTEHNSRVELNGNDDDLRDFIVEILECRNNRTDGARMEILEAVCRIYDCTAVERTDERKVTIRSRPGWTIDEWEVIDTDGTVMTGWVSEELAQAHADRANAEMAKVTA